MQKTADRPRSASALHDRQPLGPAPSLPEFSTRNEMLQTLNQDSQSMSRETSSRSQVLSDTVIQSLHLAQEAFLSAIQGIVEQSLRRKQDYAASTAPQMASTSSASSQCYLPDLLTLANETLKAFDMPAEVSLIQTSTELEQLNVALFKLMPFLPPKDRQVVNLLRPLLDNIDRLLTTSAAVKSVPSTPVRSAVRNSLPQVGDLYTALDQNVKILKSDSKSALDSTAASAMLEVERAEQDLLWGRIDDLLEQISAICRTPAVNQNPEVLKRRSEYEPSISEYSLSDLPIYSANQSANLEGIPPEYKIKEDTVKAQLPKSNDEKRQLELDGITTAIERLYSVSPQLANQRVDPLKKDRRQIREMQLARLTSAIERLSKGRLEDQRAVLPSFNSPKSRSKSSEKLQYTALQEELDQILDAIGKSSNSDMVNQRVSLSTRQQKVLRNAAKTAQDAVNAYGLSQQELKSREAILAKSGVGRIATQDAKFSNPFSNSAAISQIQVDENLAMRERSRSVPSLGIKRSLLFQKNSITADGQLFMYPDLLLISLDLTFQDVQIRYICLDQRNLKSLILRIWIVNVDQQPSWTIGRLTTTHVQIFLTTTPTVSVNVSFPQHVDSSTIPISSLHPDHSEFAFKYADPSSSILFGRLDDIKIPMSAKLLQELKPSSFDCSGCSCQLLALPASVTYRALPSEHWAELVEAWICHQDQELNSAILSHNAVLLPQLNEILVGSYHLVMPAAIFQKSGNLLMVNVLPCYLTTLAFFFAPGLTKKLA